MHLNKIALIPTLLSLFILPACGSKKSKKRDVAGPTAKVEYFVHGNPTILIQGSTQNKTSFLKVEELDRYKNFTLSGFTAFVERSPKDTPKNWDDVEDENSTESEEDAIRKAFELNDFQFVETQAGKWSYQDGQADSVELGFVEKDGVLNLATFKNFPVQIQHYSLKDDGTAFSVLFTIPTQSEGLALVSLSFASNADVQPLVFAPENYSYLFGSAKVSWKQPMKLQACGKFSPFEQASIEASIKAWFQDKEVANFTSSQPLAFSFTETYAPFSDLNQQCIHLVRNFKAESSDDFYIAGLAVPSVNAASKSFVDSDVFVFVDHFEVRSELIAGDSETLIHEIGHYLGLGHEFRKDENEQALHPSIMGYSQGISSISEWDFAAVRGLYGAPLQPAPEL
ncbi:hypothetical protein [Oligoflexus tunisiensis]|uniref:hypothetical protein n=1 Tax=Oligoflexus tunisiensis TaxID=708132 RepID=UPI00114D04DA|nr:hypothetical protein [Oligoflexus tunisiensis]